MSAQEHPWERRADRVLGIAASAILMAMMCLTFVDVVARYVFNRPLRGGFDPARIYLHGNAKSAEELRAIDRDNAVRLLPRYR